jgi:hypothetical protein
LEKPLPWKKTLTGYRLGGIKVHTLTKGLLDRA